MLFPTYQFLIFFIVIFSFGSSFKSKIGLYKLFLLFVSLVFYSFWSLNFLALLVVSIAVNYYILRALYFTKSKARKIIFIGGLTFNFIYLGIFKYYNFFADSLFEFLNNLNIQFSFQVLQIIAPVGVSFYIFRIISHLADCYTNKIYCPSFLDYATYISYFPQIASGPISRSPEFYEQLNSANKYDYEIPEVLGLILSGLFKKYTLSSFLFDFTQLPFSSPQQYSSLDLIIAATSYSCLIYLDFSGYSDLANGISSLLGFKPIQNFNMPYRSESLQEFWRRWHISLSEWLRDYLYIPLGGNKYGPLRKYINLFLTMLIGGFWHGVGLNFIIWGALHGWGLIANHLWKELVQRIHINRRAFALILHPCLNWFLTFSFVTICWIFFNTTTYETAAIFIRGIVYSDVKSFQFNFWQLYLVFFIVFLMNFCGTSLRKIFIKMLAVENLFIRVAIASSFAYVILMLGPSTVPPFIYFNF